MSFLRLVGRSLRDVFEQLTSLFLYSVLWWVSVVTVIYAPVATVTLFAMADPRRQIMSTEFSDSIDVMKTSFRRSWAIFLCTVPLIVVLIWNTYYFGGTNEALRILIPLWILMSGVLIVLTLFAFSIAGTMESGVRNAFRGAIYVLISRPYRGFLLGIFLLILTVLLSVAVLPMLFIGPALIAAIVNRFVFDGLNVEVMDPNAPTNERADEHARGINPDRGVLHRLRGNNQRR
ncbi:MAG: hypothetical protein WKF81_07310 [Thermomicrobiales bacterium]